MSSTLTGLCRDHSFESAVDLCRRCGLEYCDRCVVYPFGPKKPLCKECAMALSGVRSHAARGPMSSRLVKKRARAFAARASEGVASTSDEVLVNAEPTASPGPAPTPAGPESPHTALAGFGEVAPVEIDLEVAVPVDDHRDEPLVGAGVTPGGEAAGPAVIDWSQPFG